MNDNTDYIPGADYYDVDGMHLFGIRVGNTNYRDLRATLEKNTVPELRNICDYLELPYKKYRFRKRELIIYIRMELEKRRREQRDE